jgi:hypothetical protein
MTEIEKRILNNQNIIMSAIIVIINTIGIPSPFSDMVKPQLNKAIIETINILDGEKR